MKIRLAQLVITKDIVINKEKIINVLEKSQKREWVVFPEGMLSGYYPEDDNYPECIDKDYLEVSIEEITELVKEKDVNCFFGTAFFKAGNWYNAVVFISHKGERLIYKKVNLATLDKKCFIAGNNLDVYEVDNVKFGIQLCRDVAFPEQWKVLKHKGAQVVFHINNAIRENDINRKHVLISRAFENQNFVISVNNASEPQTLPSLVISPFGEIRLEIKPRKESVEVIEINLSEVKTDYIKQERTDLVKVNYK